MRNKEIRNVTRVFLKIQQRDARAKVQMTPTTSVLILRKLCEHYFSEVF